MPDRSRPSPNAQVELADGRVLAADDVGDPGGWPVVYVHGSPDSRLARHPDDEVATSIGVRLIAVDRPGFGHSSNHREGTVGSFGRDVGQLADSLEIDHFSVLGWSAGALPALGVAAELAPRVTRVGVAAGLPPIAAYQHPAVLDAADEGRRMLADMGAELGAVETARELVPYLVPLPITMDLAREHLLESADPVRAAELRSVPGAIDVMAAAMVDAVRQGLDGLTRDLELQLLPPDVELAAVTCPVTLWYGSADTTAPPAFGRWYADHLLRADLHVLDGAGHCLTLPRWAELLGTLLPQR